MEKDSSISQEEAIIMGPRATADEEVPPAICWETSLHEQVLRADKTTAMSVETHPLFQNDDEVLLEQTESSVSSVNSSAMMMMSEENITTTTTIIRRRRRQRASRSNSPVTTELTIDVDAAQNTTPRVSNNNNNSSSSRRTTRGRQRPSFTPPRWMSPRNRQRLSSSTSWWLIPADHPLKVLWDILTVLLSFVAIYMTHQQIRDRTFDSVRYNYGRIFLDAWFIVDVGLNFVTQHKFNDGTTLTSGRAVFARYLTTWFVIDILSLLPWESVYMKPIILKQKRRHFLKKSFFRTRAVVRVGRFLRGRHFKLFGQVARHTKHAGVGANRLLRLLIKHVPKYLLFYRNMRGVLMVRVLRQVHWMRKVFKNVWMRGDKQDDDDMTDQTFFDDDESEEDDSDYRISNDEYDEDDDDLVADEWEQEDFEEDYDDEEEDDDDDGAPF